MRSRCPLAEAVRRAYAYGLTNVRFLPPQPPEELPAWLNAADIGLSTLVDQEVDHSAIPVKMLSYMACGLPIVSSDRRHGWQCLAVLPWLFFCVHVCYGLGTLAGAVRFGLVPPRETGQPSARSRAG
ncbi:MAG: glycosyltransferase [Phycisphaerae bacterium]